ncbi:MAG: adenosine kinase [Alphaproteobacteria bacterium]
MSDKSAGLDVVGIGNAIVDVLAHAEDRFLEDHGLTKGAMTLIDGAQAETLYESMGPGIEVSGGSVANTMAGLASLGGSGAFFGKVRNDQLGKVFAHDIRAAGISYKTAPALEGAPTARCLIFVTPDAQRTMQTFLGASVEFGPDEVAADTVVDAKITYLEGYLFDPPQAKAAFVKAAEIAHAAGRKVALSLSDPFCVERHRGAFLDLVDGHIDVLFANEEEIVSLYKASSFDDALQSVRGKCDIACLTRSEKGSVIVAGDEVHIIDAVAVEHVLDSTGAGDLYAAGVLYGLTNGHALVSAGRIGAICAGEAISHLGARPEVTLKDLVAGELG